MKKIHHTQDDIPAMLEQFDVENKKKLGKNTVMSTSAGSSCPDCYDRMSM